MTTYTIQPGDTLGKIAKQFYGDASRYQEIADANNLANPSAISIGQTLTIPGLEPAPQPNLEPDPGNPSRFSEQQLQTIMPHATTQNINKYLNPLNSQLPIFQVNTPMRKAHFIAQIAHESGSFRLSVENLNYRAQALHDVFGKYFPTDKLANQYAHKPEQIASRVYANRMGNGDEASGDGWKYRGRGLIQLTGTENYRLCGQDLSLDLLQNPDQLANDPKIAIDGAGWYWDSKNLNKWADEDNIEKITRLINGGLNGFDDRKQFLARAKKVLGLI